mmetsp:Transcript_8886/g.13333  ORF Transcript_8886/g.13333 Transcript_8886/m.13333 type:complete len:138 (-) Transcript_8886:160-573(-)
MVIQLHMSIGTESSFILMICFLRNYSLSASVGGSHLNFSSSPWMGWVAPFKPFGKMDWDEVQECAKFGLFIVHSILCYCGRASSFECHRMNNVCCFAHLLLSRKRKYLNQNEFHKQYASPLSNPGNRGTNQKPPISK